MKLSTWAATLSILTSSIVIVGTCAIVCFTEPHVPRTHPPTLPSARPVEPGPRFEYDAAELPLGLSRDTHPAPPLLCVAGSFERRTHVVALAMLWSESSLASESSTETVRPEIERLFGVSASPGSGVHAMAHSQGLGNSIGGAFSETHKSEDANEGSAERKAERVVRHGPSSVLSSPALLASDLGGVEPLLTGKPLRRTNQGRSQGVRLASERETRVVHLSAPGVVAETAPGYYRPLALGAFVSATEGPSTRLQAASGTRIPMTSGQYDRAKRQAKSLSTDPKLIAGPSDRERGVTGWRDSQQAFEGGAAWKDTQQDRGSKERPPATLHGRTPMEAAGVEPGHHLRALASQATIERAISAAGLCGVPAGIGLRLFARESGLRQFDSRGRLLVSRSGAIGIGQIKPSSAAEVSPTLDVRDEWQNMVASMCYLSSRRGTWREKVLSYNVGASGLRTAAAHAYADSILEGEK